MLRNLLNNTNLLGNFRTSFASKNILIIPSLFSKEFIQENIDILSKNSQNIYSSKGTFKVDLGNTTESNCEDTYHKDTLSREYINNTSNIIKFYNDPSLLELLKYIINDQNVLLIVLNDN